MKFDASSLPAKDWVAPSEVIAAISSITATNHDRLVAKVEIALTNGKVELRGRRAQPVETQVEFEPDESESDRVEPEEALRPVNLFASGISWVDKAYDQRTGMMATRTIEVMKPMGDPEAIDTYYLCGEHTLDWENDQLRCGVDAEWHEVRFNRNELAAVLGEHTGTLTTSAKEKILTNVEEDFKRRVDKWPADQPFPSEIDDLNAMKEKYPNLTRAAFREIRKRISPPEWRKQGRRA